ncbi:MAG: DUF1634 domain-containing protein [Armatimonadetes bacterium]|nr:DUF1634 domain-containing protein [Armatimonadota bacterium]
MRWTDQQIEEFIGVLLRVGVTISAAVVLLGGILYLHRHGSEPVHLHIFRSEPKDLRDIVGILRDAEADRAVGIMQLGVLLLIATPIARVAFSIFAFLAVRDRFYAGVTAFVLLVLLYSITFGR